MDMTFLPAHAPTWSNRLAFDIALRLEGSGEPLESILKTHGITAEVLAGYGKDPAFEKQVEYLRTEIREKGLSFKLKAKSQAEDLLTTSWLLIHNPDVSPAVKADLIKSTVKWAGLDSSVNADVGGNTGGVKITINLGGSSEPIPVVDVQAEDADAEYS